MPGNRHVQATHQNTSPKTLFMLGPPHPSREFQFRSSKLFRSLLPKRDGCPAVSPFMLGCPILQVRNSLLPRLQAGPSPRRYRNRRAFSRGSSGKALHH